MKMLSISYCTAHFLQDISDNMFRQIESLERATNNPILSNSQDFLATLMGKMPENMQAEECIVFLQIVATNVYDMYHLTMFYGKNFKIVYFTPSELFCPRFNVSV